MKIFVTLLIFILSFNLYAETKIGIVVPMEHEAMHEIVSGFKTTLKNQYTKSISFKVANAQNDQNLQNAIIRQMRDSNYDLIVTIATHTAEMATHIIKNKPIIALAADISEKTRQALKPCNVAVVDDEVATKKIIQFIHQTYPSLKNMVLIHSASEKIFPEVAEAKQSASKVRINLKDITIQNLMDLQSVARNFSKDYQAIFILKDSLVVNGIAQLVKIAKTHHIPLISSDDGSVKKGAGFSLGVRESQIGVEGAELALQILQGKNAGSLPIHTMNNLFVFVNSDAVWESQQTLQPILATAKKLHYEVNYIKN